MKKKLYIVSCATSLVGIISHDYLPWNSFTSVKKAKQYLNKAKDSYIRKPEIYKVEVTKQ